MKTPNKLAEDLIADFIVMMPNGIDKIGYDFKTQYEVAKVQAEYSAHIVKWAFKKGSEQYKYWEQVQNEIKKL